MSKQDFLTALRRGLSDLPQEDVEERLAFYSEMIDDRMEEGLSEEDAVSAVGAVDEIASQIVADSSPARSAKEKPQRRLTAWGIVLLILGSPIWLPLGVAAVAVVLSLYAVLWSVIVSLWTVFAALVGCALGGVAGGVGFACGGQTLSGAATVGAGLVCAGLSIFLFFGCKAATDGVLTLTKAFAVRLKSGFVKKEEA